MKKQIFSALIVFYLFLFTAISFCQNEENREEKIAVFSAKIVVDQYYQIAREKEDWRQSTANLIERVNQKLQSQGVKIKIEIAEISLWLINEKVDTLEEALYDLRVKFLKGDNDLVIGLTRKKFSPKDNAGGYYLFPGYIIAKDYAEFNFNGKEITIFDNWTEKALIHEIGHFFGLDHNDNPDSIMHSKALSNKFLKEEVEYINRKAQEIKSDSHKTPKK